MSEWVATVGYIRSMKIATLAVWCEGKRLGGYLCNHQAAIDLAPYPDELSCQAIEGRLVCTHCGAIGKVDARPNWTEHRRKRGSEARGWIQPPPNDRDPAD